MQTLLCQKNKETKTEHSQWVQQQGFTLIECILAIGILSVVVASIVGLQSSIISVTQIASDGMRASWAARSTISQMQYLIDTQGQTNIPENTTIPWVTDNQFSINIKRTELKDVKISQFLTSALGVYNLVNPAGNENLDVDKTLGTITTMLDTSAGSNPKGFFSNVVIEVKWTSGITPKTISEGFFFMDKDTFANVTLPDLGGKSDGGNNNNNGGGTPK
jgi:prepilin-type N-terminal cleavage/methylation domain-containing protein